MTRTVDLCQCIADNHIGIHNSGPCPWPRRNDGGPFCTSCFLQDQRRATAQRLVRERNS